MKRILFTIATFVVCNIGFGQGYTFTTIDSVPITSIKDQNQSSTCWSFSTLSMIESELLRMGEGEFDLSEMFVVHKTMEDRAKASVRLHGDISFSPGGSFYDVLYCYKNYGMVPEDAMPGIMYGANKHDHKELEAVAEAYVNAIATGNLKKISNVWQIGLSGIYDAYLGKCPESFTYKGKEYTPKSFAKELGINPDDYISLTSFNHHPFYEQFSVEIQDNWRHALSYNLPIEELLTVITNSIKSGYSVAWGTDVSETGFSRGLAIVPADTIDVKKALADPSPEKEITQELRQQGFDDWSTTEDHGMLIFGITRDQNGKEYFMVKNSWDYDSGRNGIWYVSKAFVAYKTINIVVNRNAIPKEIQKKVNLK